MLYIDDIPMGNTTYSEFSINNISIEVDFDDLPRNLSKYYFLVDSIFQKKQNSKSPWLLIWSVDFIYDRHTFGKETISFMKKKFADSHFEKVYFLESGKMNEEYFYVNLKLHEIK